MNTLPGKSWRKQRRCLTGLVVGLILIGLFYTEENWRGQRAWENCKRAVKAQGVELNWASYIPAPVPDNENVFGVTEMQRWFVGGGPWGWTDLVRKLPSRSFPGVNIDSNTPRMFVAEVTIGLPGTPAQDGSAALRWNDSASRTEAARLLTTALGPTAKAPQSPIGVGLMLRRPDEVQAARIFLQCQTAPTEKDLREFLPDSILQANASVPERVLKFEADGSGSYRVTMPVLGRAADYLAWSEGLDPQFALIRRALQRPSSRMPGFYDNPDTTPVSNFRSARSLVQTLGARAECHFLLDQPEEAVRDLTLIHDFCRIFEEQKPMGLLAAMINVAVRGLYAGQIADGLRLHAWREPQLAALAAQLKTIGLLSPIKQAFTMEAVVNFHTLERVPSTGLVKSSTLGGLCPRGWGYQHIVTRVYLDFDRLASLDTANQIIFPDKVDAVGRSITALSHWSPYTFIARLEPANFPVACQRTAHTQTEVNQGLIACALERYHLARGEYPENLDALLPRFLDKIPHDIIGGQPPHFRRTADGTFVLYSIGWNGRDNGGVRGKSSSITDGDWVWPD